MSVVSQTFQTPNEDANWLGVFKREIKLASLHVHMDTTNYISLPLLFKSQGWVEAGATCFRQHDFNKSPPFIFPIPCFCLTWCLSTGPAYHTVRKPVRQTPNEDEYPSGPKSLRQFSISFVIRVQDSFSITL